MAVSTSLPAPLSSTSVRLLHASDLHLERVPTGLREVPEHLRDRLVDSSYAAARRVFETALAEEVDAVLLAGDVVDLSLAGPRAIAFLAEQFERLATQGIEVYWAGGRVDPPHAWPRVAPLPPNVHVFPVEHVQHFDLHKGGDPVARIVGISSEGEAQVNLSRFIPHPDGLLTVGVAYGRFSQADLADQRIPYLALGGRHERKSWTADDRTRFMHQPGTPQGTSPAEPGPHGCTLVTFTPEGTIKAQMITTDVFRWHRQKVQVGDSTELSELERQLVAQADGLRNKIEDGGLLLEWEVVGTGPAVDALRRRETRRAVADRLRQRFGHEAPYLWTAQIEVRREAGLAPALLEEETILGDVLREIQKLHEEPAAELQLASYLSPADRNGPLADRLATVTPQQHQRILEETGEACVALLSGRHEEAPFEHSNAKAG